MKIVVIGTLDTKGAEVGFVRDQIAALGGTPIVIDAGILGEPGIPANIARTEIALAGGEALADLVARRDKARAQTVIMAGLTNIVTRLFAEGDLQGVIAVGGAQGTALATAAMRALPFGVPKVMVSTVACGQTTFGPYVGTKDVTMIHSVADISGLNRLTRRVLAQAASAVVAMASVSMPDQGERELIAITQAGVTTQGVMGVKERLEKLGFEVVAFHCNGIGGEAMEELIRDGVIKGVIDFSPHEVTDLLFNGLMPAMPDRLRAAGQMGIPQVVVPGCTDNCLQGPPDEMPEGLKQRRWVRHTPTHTHVRTTPQEMAAVAHFIAERLNAGTGPRASAIPLRGFSMLNREGEVLYDEAANMGYVQTMRRELSPDVGQVEVDAHINSPEFVEATVNTFLRLREEAASA
ncbi:MAG TPA: Tm-1-like ATP-binding domain-containing protein [Chloroflexota bacterium]